MKFNSEGLIFVNEFDEEQSGANMGAVLAGAYSFIAAMADLGSVDVPLVVDSPVTGMDFSTAESWCQAIWPQFDQIVAFITPGERGLIEKRRGGNTKLYGRSVKRVTMHRKDEKKSGKPQKGKMVLNSGDAWFRGYQADGKAEKGR